MLHIHVIIIIVIIMYVVDMILYNLKSIPSNSLAIYFSFCYIYVNM